LKLLYACFVDPLLDPLLVLVEEDRSRKGDPTESASLLLLAFLFLLLRKESEREFELPTPEPCPELLNHSGTKEGSRFSIMKAILHQIKRTIQ
jgi:hypothetical protein